MGRAVPVAASFQPGTTQSSPNPPQLYWGPGKGCAPWLGRADRAMCHPHARQDGCSEQGRCSAPPLPPGVRVGMLKAKPTHNLSLRPTKIQVEHLGAVIRGHLQLLEGLLEQDGPAEPGLTGGDGEALVDVDGQSAVLPLPRAS